MIALLSGHSLTVADRFKPEKMQLSLAERTGTAVITAGPDAPAIAVGDWLKDETNPGAGIVWRVKSVDTDYATNTRTINCEHLINCLKDRIMFGEITPKNITGNAKAENCWASQAAAYIIGHQGDWRLGSLSPDVSNPYNFNGDNLFSALETVSSSLTNPWWQYDFSSYPFTLSIIQPDENVQCEMRMDRNIKTLRRLIDRTRMYTRFYPIGKNDLHIDGEYVSRNEEIYGVVSKVETDGEKDTQAKLIAWANERLNNHAEPLVTITVNGLELADATGEPLDRLTLGKMCRVPLPEYGTTITERITKLNWSDKVADPESVSITMANQIEDVASIVNAMKKSAGGGGRSQAKKEGEDHAWMVDTDEHVGLVAEAVAGPGADQDWSRVSSIFVDGEGIHQKVVKTQGDVVAAFAAIEVNENKISQEVSTRISENTQLSSRITQTSTAITSEVQARINSENQLSSRITQTAASITAEVTRATTAEGNLSSRITVNAQGIETKVSKNGVISAINQTAESVTIQANRINLDGYVTSSMLESAFTSASQISTQQLTISSYFTCLGYNVSWKEETFTTYSVSSEYYFVDYLDTQHKGRIITGTGSKKIYYLGR